MYQKTISLIAGNSDRLKTKTISSQAKLLEGSTTIRKEYNQAIGNGRPLQRG